jgi:3-oxoacyl-[acyl-carrier-protein] synthase-1
MSAVITGVSGITSLGFSVPAIAAAIRAPISAFRESRDYADSARRPVLVSEIPIVEGMRHDMDRVTRLRSLSRACLEALLAEITPAQSGKEAQVYLLIGVASPGRPGPRYQGVANELQFALAPVLRERFNKWAIRFVESGNPAAIEALDQARRVLQAQPETICIVGGLDSLLDNETLDYFEGDARLKSTTYGRHQGLIPGEGMGFLVLESAEFAQRRARRPLAQVLGAGLAREPAPLRSPDPSTFTGLTEACRAALTEAGSTAAPIDAIIGDLNGEFFRAKEWAHTELRCLAPAAGERQLWHPADCFGDVGAATGALLVNFGVSLLKAGAAASRVLCFCSDDDGARGAVVLGRPWPQAA